MTVTKRKPKPTTAHPMFPYVTALWFATFLGLGSFAVAPALLEGPVVALGLPALVPAAAPPLGFTARVLFALAMMGIGAIAGYLVGRALGRGKVEAPVRARGFGKQASNQASNQILGQTGFEARRPINPAEDLGEPLDAPIAQDVPLRRRALSLHDESQLSTPFESAPLPGLLPWEIAAQQADAERESAPVAGPMLATPVDPLALELLLEDAQTFGQTSCEPVATSVAETDADLEQPLASSPLTFEAPASEEAAPAIEETAAIAPVAPARSYQPSPILQAQPATSTPIEHAALDSLGLVQLIERLALAISRRTRRVDPAIVAPAADLPAPTTAPEPRDIPRFGSLPQVDQALAAPAEFRAAPERVVQLRPAQFQPVAPPEFDTSIGVDDADEEEEDLGLDRFLRMSPLRTREPAPPTDDLTPDDVASGDFAPEPEVAEERYPSLLDIGPVAARREPLRIDDGIADEPEEDAAIEPVVVFPGQQQQARQFERPSITPLAGSPLAAPGRAAPSPPSADMAEDEAATQPGPTLDADEADRALRAALATLQRMTAQG